MCRNYPQKRFIGKKNMTQKWLARTIFNLFPILYTMQSYKLRSLIAKAGGDSLLRSE
jgi:hypothetical protein